MSEPDGLHTLGRWSSDRARATPDRIAVDDRGVALSYRELDRRARSLADALRSAGYGVGERIATVTGNSADQVVLFFACAKAGIVLVPLSWRLTRRELAEQLGTADPTLLLIEDEFATLGRGALELIERPPAVTQLGAHGVEKRVPPPLRRLGGEPVRRAVRDGDGLLMTFTSGTLGKPKGVVLSHVNCFWTNLSLSRTVDITSEDVVLAVMPQFHVGGWNIQPLLAWWVGATVVLERTFDAGRALQLIASRRITTMMGVPANYLLLAQHPAFAETDLGSLRHALVGGAPMPVPLLRTWHGRGVSLTQGYGLTEAAPNVLCLPDEDAYQRAGSAGRPYPHVEVALADPVTGTLLDDDDDEEQGELLVRGPAVFRGYFRDPVQTALALHDGWLHTGDLARRDADGYFTIVDRLKDIYISGGESVSPAEVEGVLFGHPAVADVGVVGVPDEHWGEVGVAFVVARADRATDEQELLAFARTALAGYKVPKSIPFIDRIPRSSSDKVMRKRLLEIWKEAVR